MSSMDFSIAPPLVPPPDFRSGFVLLAGRPNAGKSSLVNRLVGEKVVIVTPKPQTTRNSVRCVLTTASMQAVLVDTPGVHEPHSPLNEAMMESLRDSMDGIDLVLYLLEVTSSGPAQEEVKLLSELFRKKCPVILLMAKADLSSSVDPSLRWNPETDWAGPGKFTGIIDVSSKTGLGIPELLSTIEKNLDLGPMYFPPDQLMDTNERFLVREIVREKIMLLTRNEIPHATGVQILDMKDLEDGSSRIHAEIMVETNSQKRIVIGHGGSLLKTIGIQSRKDIELVLGRTCHLNLWVKVAEKWRKKKKLLREIVFG
jgi:GTP-binding protein Era